MLDNSRTFDPTESDVISNHVTPDRATPKGFNKFRWLGAALDLAKGGPRKLSHAELHVLVVAYDFSDGEGKKIYPSNRTWDERANVSSTTRESALRRLCQLGYLLLVKRGGSPKGGGSTGRVTTCYRLNPSLDAKSPSPQ